MEEKFEAAKQAVDTLFAAASETMSDTQVFGQPFDKFEVLYHLRRE